MFNSTQSGRFWYIFPRGERQLCIFLKYYKKPMKLKRKVKDEGVPSPVPP